MRDGTAQETVLYGIGVAGHLPCDRVLQLRDYHPSAQPGFQIEVRASAGLVEHADLRMGLMHRGTEKLYEARDYRQIMMLANRHDWLSAFSSELGVALAVEAATGISPPERATWTRTLLAEANRVAVALAFLAPVAPNDAQSSALFAARELLSDFQERATGARVHPMFTRIGGIAAPLTLEQLTDCAELVDRLSDAAADAVTVAAAIAPELTGLAVLDHETAVSMGASGPVARASGIDLDLRRDEAYAAYGDLADLLEVPVARAGDAAARYSVLAAQIPISLRLMSACIERLRGLGDGPIDVLLPKAVRVPEGVSHAWMEGPLGIGGYLIASVGEKTPWRLKLRSAAFNNVQAMAPALVGVPIEQLANAVMSFLVVVGDVDR